MARYMGSDTYAYDHFSFDNFLSEASRLDNLVRIDWRLDLQLTQPISAFIVLFNLNL